MKFLTSKSSMTFEWWRISATKKLTNNTRLWYTYICDSLLGSRRMRFRITHDLTGNLADWIVASRLFIIQMKTPYRRDRRTPASIIIRIRRRRDSSVFFYSDVDYHLLVSSSVKYIRDIRVRVSSYDHPTTCRWCIVIIPLLLQHLTSGIMHFGHL